MTNIIKKRTEQTTEKTGISFVETVDISGLWRKETIEKYKKLSERVRQKRHIKNHLKDSVKILRILNMRALEFT